jgi:hypothetical protein
VLRALAAGPGALPVEGSGASPIARHRTAGGLRALPSLHPESVRPETRFPA